MIVYNLFQGCQNVRIKRAASSDIIINIWLFALRNPSKL